MKIESASYATGKGAGKVVITLIDHSVHWVSAAVFERAAGGMSPNSFKDGNFEGKYYPKGHVLNDGTVVTDDNKILDNSTVSLSLAPRIVAEMAAIVQERNAEKAFEAALKRKLSRINAEEEVNAD